MELQSGPSKGGAWYYGKTIVAPTNRFIRHRTLTGIYHINQQHGIKFKGESFLDPKDVSFVNIQRREGTSTAAVCTGWFAPLNGYVHPVGSWFSPSNPDITNGCYVVSDTTGFSGSASDTIGQSGTWTGYIIIYEYTGDDTVERGMGTIESLKTVEVGGNSKAKKGSVGWVPVGYNAATTNSTW